MWEPGNPSLFLSTKNNSLSVGAGAITLDRELKGQSIATNVFNNPPFGEAEEFECVAVELWALL